MPRVLGAYRPEDVAREEARALTSAPTERTVGGLMASWALVDAIAPNTALRVLGPFAKLWWRMRDKRPVNHSDSLTQPLTRARQRIGFRTRPSVLVKLRDLRQGSVDALQTRRRGTDRHELTAQRPAGIGAHKRRLMHCTPASSTTTQRTPTS
jgi:hypothetical protein